MLSTSNVLRKIDGKLKCDICNIEKAIIRCEKCENIVYCSEKCRVNDKDHNYICYKDLSSYIYAIITLHKMGECGHSQCIKERRGETWTIMIHYGHHNIKISNSLTINTYVAYDMCIICGNKITIYDKDYFCFYNGGFKVIYQKCGECLKSNYSICSKKLINNVICSNNDNKNIIFTIMIMKHVNDIINDVKQTIIHSLIKLRCCGKPDTCK